MGMWTVLEVILVGAMLMYASVSTICYSYYTLFRGSFVSRNIGDIC